jgi:hypothetical protein
MKLVHFALASLAATVAVAIDCTVVTTGASCTIAAPSNFIFAIIGAFS